MNNSITQQKYDLHVINANLQGLLSEITIEEPKLKEAIEWSVLNGGGRIRPLMFMDVCSSFDCFSQPLLDTSCAIEFLHCASLVLDDLPVMDDATIRRNLECTHVKFGSETALFAASFLQFYAMRVILNSCYTLMREGKTPESIDVRVISVIQNCIAEAVTGQFLDLTSDSSSEEEIINVYSKKTSSVFRSLAELAGIMCNQSEEVLDQLIDLAEDFGIAFQLKDDLIDAGVVQTKNLKDLGNDENKSAFTTVFGTKKTIETYHAYLEKISKHMNALGTTREDFNYSLKFFLDDQITL